MSISNAPARLRSVQDLAAHLGVPVQTVYVWRTRGLGPRAMKIGKFVKFDPADVAAWQKQQKEPV